MTFDKTSDVFIRTSWAHADVALIQLNKGKAEGSHRALWLRARIQAELFHLGCLLHSHPGKVIFVASLLLATFCVGLKSAVLHSRVDQLWVQEGGTVEKELRYRSAALGDNGGSTHQLVIQTTESSSVLHQASLLSHVDMVKAAVSISVQLFDITWRLKDICYSPNIPSFDLHYIDQIFENIIPCSIITPLDCFWEGSKLLGPDYPVTIPGLSSKVRWTNLNPQKIIEKMKTYETGFPIETLEQHLKRAGISTGYQEKPCLNPLDEECPETAPNKQSKKVPNIGAELTGGCYGFAANYMHWPEELIVGGAKKNKTGHIQRAQALQTVVQLMGERELHEFWSDTYKVHHIDWNQEKAARVLDTWQRSFSQEVNRLMGRGNKTSPYNVYAFSTATLNDVLFKFSQLNILKVAIGYLIMLIYAGVSLICWEDPARSQCALGIAGVILISVTVAAGLGFCAVLGIAFNASTTQIVPFLALGLGVDDVILLTHTYAEQVGDESQPEEQTGLLLKKCGLPMLLTSLSRMCAMFAAAIIPVPALRVFSLQSAVLVLFNLASSILVFPAIVSLDVRRRNAGRSDLLACWFGNGTISNMASTAHSRQNHSKHIKRHGSTKKQAVTRALPPDRQQTVTVLANSENGRDINEAKCNLYCPKFSWFTTGYSKFLLSSRCRVIVVISFLIITGLSFASILRLKDGLELTDVVPRATAEHSFLDAQTRYFGFYNMYGVTQGDFEYPNNQRLLYEYHEAFMRVQAVVKNDDGGLPPFWLSLFRDWLIGLQKSFERDWERGTITQEWWFPNASDEGVLAYKLLVQTGHVDNPIDKSLVTQVKLVDSDGMINPKAFYNYLSAWYSNDALAYGASEGNLQPIPREWYHVRQDFDLKIPKSGPLIYSQLPFYLHGLTDTPAITKTIEQVREICSRFETRGLPNFPSGVPFLFWEQYRHLRPLVGISSLLSIVSVSLIAGIVLVSSRIAILIGASLTMNLVHLLGFMSAFGLSLSAVPAVLIIIATGISARFIIYFTLSFVTSIGNRERRSKLAIEHTFAPILRGSITVLISIAMLAFSEFDFIVRYFFQILGSVVGVSFINGIIFLPVILSIIGPSAEVRPLNQKDRISTPSPQPSRKMRRIGSHHSGSVIPPSHIITPCQTHREPSLTTITEEPSWHSTTHEIIVEPEFIVQTTTCTAPNSQQMNNGGCNGGCSSSGCSNSGNSSDSSDTKQSAAANGQQSQQQQQQQQQQHITTKVTATAKLKVEVHTPIGNVESYGGKSRRSHRMSRESSSSSDMEMPPRTT